MSKSEKIRDYLSKNPNASAAEIVKALKKERVKVSMPLIYQQLAKAKSPRKARGSKSSRNGNGISVASLMEAKKLVSQTGSISEAEKVLNLLAQLTS